MSTVNYNMGLTPSQYAMSQNAAVPPPTSPSRYSLMSPTAGGVPTPPASSGGSSMPSWATQAGWKDNGDGTVTPPNGVGSMPASTAFPKQTSLIGAVSGAIDYMSASPNGPGMSQDINNWMSGMGGAIGQAANSYGNWLNQQAGNIANMWNGPGGSASAGAGEQGGFGLPPGSPSNSSGEGMATSGVTGASSGAAGPPAPPASFDGLTMNPGQPGSGQQGYPTPDGQAPSGLATPSNPAYSGFYTPPAVAPQQASASSATPSRGTNGSVYTPPGGSGQPDASTINGGSLNNAGWNNGSGFTQTNPQNYQGLLSQLAKATGVPMPPGMGGQAAPGGSGSTSLLPPGYGGQASSASNGASPYFAANSGGGGASGGTRGGIPGNSSSNAGQTTSGGPSMLQNAQNAADQQNAFYNQAQNGMDQLYAGASTASGGGYPSMGSSGMGGGMGGVPMIGGMGGNMGAGMPGLFAQSPGNNAAAGQLVGNAANSFQQAQNDANKANTDLANQITGGFNNLSNQSANALGGLSGLFGNQQNQFGNSLGNIMNGFGNLGATQNAGYSNLVNQLSQGQQGINSGYDNVENQIMNNLSLLGSTQAQDINQAYQNQKANANQDLVNRGLGNTTINQSVNSGLDFNRQRSLMGNAANTQQMVNNALMQTAYPALQSRQQGLNNVTNLAQQGLGANTALGVQALGQGYQGAQDMANLQGQALGFGERANNTQNQLGLDQLQFLNSINQSGPNYGMLAQLMQAVGAAGTGYGVNGYSAIPASAGNVAPSSVLGQLQGPGTAGYGGVPMPPKQLGS